jgi:uncharacterized protein
MILGRRLPRSLPQRLRGWLWPPGGWRRAGRYLLARLRRMPGTPHAIAAGFAAGAAMSLTPFLGGHVLLALALAWATRGNLLAAALGTLLVGNPWALPLILAAAYRLGCLLLGQPPRGLGALAALDLGVLLDGVGRWLWPMVVGSAPLAVAAWVAAYFPLVRVMATVRERRRREQERRATTRPAAPEPAGSLDRRGVDG